MADSSVEEASKNIITIEDAGPCLKRVGVETPPEAVNDYLGMSIDTLQVEAALPGFRKGHAPRRLVEKRFGSVVRTEAKKQLIASAYSEAIEKHELKVLGDPHAEGIEDLDLVEDEAFKFSFEVEVLPEIELPELSGIEAKRPTAEVTDEMVSSEVQRLAKYEGELDPQETSQGGDYLTGHAVMVDGDGTSHLDLNDAVVMIPESGDDPKGMILGVMVDDFGKQIGLPKPGDTLTVKAKGPEQHEIEAVRGKDLTITFEVAKVDRIVPLEMGDLASRFGLEGEEQLKDAMRSRLEGRLALDQQAALRQQVASSLLDSIEFEMPERLSARQAERNLQRRRLELMHRGVDAAEIEEQIAELRASSADVARRELKLFFILNKAAEDLSVSVNDDEVNGRIAQMAAQRNQRPQRLRDELVNSNQIQMVAQQVREHKTLDAIIEKATVTDVPAEEFTASS